MLLYIEIDSIPVMCGNDLRDLSVIMVGNSCWLGKMAGISCFALWWLVALKVIQIIFRRFNNLEKCYTK